MKNVAASVRARLLTHARSSGRDLPALIERFAMGRLLWRLAQSDMSHKFVLKGAQLFSLWAPKLPPGTVIAEKLDAAVQLELDNSRMKDFFDLDWLCRHMEFDHGTLRAAIVATFTRRGTTLPEEAPLALTQEFANDAGKITQWKAFLRKNRLEADALPLVITRLNDFLMPVLSRHEAGGLIWRPAEGWM